MYNLSKIKCYIISMNYCFVWLEIVWRKDVNIVFKDHLFKIITHESVVKSILIYLIDCHHHVF